MPYTPEAVVSYGFPFNEFEFTYKLAAGIVAADEGKALTLDTTAASTFKLAGNGAPVHGRLILVEDRAVSGLLVGTVARKFKEKLLTVAGGVAVGDSVCGSATAGLVRTAITNVDGTGARVEATSDPITNLVVEVLADNYVVVESL